MTQFDGEKYTEFICVEDSQPRLHQPNYILMSQELRCLQKTCYYFISMYTITYQGKWQSEDADALPTRRVCI